MKVSNKILIDKPVSEVWQTLALDFHKAGEWMSVVPKSYQIESGHTVENAPMVGRICELTSKANGPFAEETITFYDGVNRTMKVNVVPKNGKLPIVQNNLVISAKGINNHQSEVTWDSDVELKTIGKILKPVLKAGLNKSFNDLLVELKYYVETGQPHPRKVKANQKLATA